MIGRGSSSPPTGFRPGVVVEPVPRLAPSQVRRLHEGSLEILRDPGIVCFNEEATSVFSDAGCSTERSAREGAWVVRIPGAVVEGAIDSAPSRVVLGARYPANRLLLDAEVPRVYFGTGSESNIFLDTELHQAPSAAGNGTDVTYPHHVPRRGSVRGLTDSARLCNVLENVDFFIRNVNIQEEEIEPSNKDVNVFLASLMYMSKHVQSGLSDVDALDRVVRMGEIVAGDAERFGEAPPISFIACLVKSPLQMVDDTTTKVIRIARRGLPLVISSSPQGGSTAPVQEEGMIMLINAEILAGVTLSQLVRPGAPVLYGAVPVRARLDTLHDLYGAPEFIHYNVGCAQMARHYRIPCYSTAGVGDSRVPGMQATVEKVFSQMAVAQSGAQYIHYAFGLLDRTSTFSPVQAIIDDANISVVKGIIRPARFKEGDVEAALGEVRKVMASGTRLFARLIRKHIRRGVVSSPYALEAEGDRDRVLEMACDRLADIRATTGDPLPRETVERIYCEVPGLLPMDRFIL